MMKTAVLLIAVVRITVVLSHGIEGQMFADSMTDWKLIKSNQDDEDFCLTIGHDPERNPDLIRARYEDHLKCSDLDRYYKMERGTEIVNPVLKLTGDNQYLKIDGSTCAVFCGFHKIRKSGILRRGNLTECHCGASTRSTGGGSANDTAQDGLYTAVFSMRWGRPKIHSYFGDTHCLEYIFDPSKSPSPKSIRFCLLHQLVDYCNSVPSPMGTGHGGLPQTHLKPEQADRIDRFNKIYKYCMDGVKVHTYSACSLRLGLIRAVYERWIGLSRAQKLLLYGFVGSSPILFIMNMVLILVLQRRRALGNPGYIHQMCLIGTELISFVFIALFSMFHTLIGTGNYTQAFCNVPLIRVFGYLHMYLAGGGLIANHLMVSCVGIIRYRSFRSPKIYRDMDHPRSAVLMMMFCYTLGISIGLSLFPEGNPAYANKSYAYRNETCRTPMLETVRGLGVSRWELDRIPHLIPQHWVTELITAEQRYCEVTLPQYKVLSFTTFHFIVSLILLAVTGLVAKEYRQTEVKIQAIIDQEITEMRESGRDEQTAMRIQVLKKREGKPKKRRKIPKINTGDGVVKGDPHLRPKTSQFEVGLPPTNPSTSTNPKDEAPRPRSAWITPESSQHTPNSHPNPHTESNDNLSDYFSDSDDEMEGYEGQNEESEQDARQKKTNKNEPPQSETEARARHESVMTALTLFSAVLHLAQTVTVSLAVACHRGHPEAYKSPLCITLEMTAYATLLAQVSIACPIYLWMTPGMREQAVFEFNRLMDCRIRQDPEEITIAQPRLD